MSEYYGDMPYSESLYHYGVKGMKWGVRRAIEKDNMTKLSNHYQRALLKKAKLKERTDREGQKSDAKSSAAGGALLLGSGALSGLAGHDLVKRPDTRSYLYGMSALSGLGGLAALTDAGMSAYRATKRGNKAAIKKYKNFDSEMNKTFSKSTKKKIYKHWKKHPEDKWIYD